MVWSLTKRLSRLMCRQLPLAQILISSVPRMFIGPRSFTFLFQSFCYICAGVLGIIVLLHHPVLAYQLWYTELWSQLNDRASFASTEPGQLMTHHPSTIVLDNWHQVFCNFSVFSFIEAKHIEFIEYFLLVNNLSHCRIIDLKLFRRGLIKPSKTSTPAHGQNASLHYADF